MDAQRFKFSRQRGNALFLILIAVALFAALSYAITLSGRGEGAGASKEQDMLAAAQVVQVMASVRAAALRMKIGGLSSDNIHFSDEDNPAAACTETDGSCVFTPEGGGLSWPTFPSTLFIPDYIGAVSNALFFESGRGDLMYSVVGAGTAAKDVVFDLQGLRQEICEDINKGLGIEGIPDATTTPSYDPLDPFVALDMQGATEACANWNGEAYHYVAVIIEN